MNPDPAPASLPEGFSLQTRVRRGTIWFREGERVLRFHCEMSATAHYDLLLSLDGAAVWVQPAGQAVAAADRARILAALETWLAAQGIRTDAFGPIKRPLFPLDRARTRPSFEV